MGFSRGSSIVTDSLKIYLATNNIKSYSGSGGTIKNLITNSSNATIGGSIIYDGSVNFDTGNEIITIPHSSQLSTILNGNFTLITLVKSTDIIYPRSRHPLVIDQNPTSTVAGLQIGEDASDSSIQIEISDGINYSSKRFTHSVQSSITYHRTFLINRISGINIKYYVNSKYIDELNTPTITGNIYSSNGIVFGNASGWRFIGNIYSIMIYDKLLSESEITQNFNVIKSQHNIS
jgi:hypothetical protein